MGSESPHRVPGKDRSPERSEVPLILTHLDAILPSTVSFPVAVIKYSERSNWGRKGMLWLTASGHSLSRWESKGVTSQPQPESTKATDALLSSLSLLRSPGS